MEFTEVDKQFLQELGGLRELVVKPRSAEPALGSKEGIPSGDPLLDLPETQQTFNQSYKKAPFTLKGTQEEVFSALRAIYMIHGMKGVYEFASESLNTQWLTQPDLTRKSIQIFDDLFKGSRIAIESIARDAVHKIEPCAQKVALDRLAQARLEIEAEGRRYFPILERAKEFTPTLQVGRGKSAIFADPSAAVSRKMLAELARIQELMKAADLARDTWAAKKKSKYWQLVGADPRVVGSLNPAIDLAVNRKLDADPELAPLKEQSEEAGQQLYKYLWITAMAYPILWRIFRTDHIHDTHLLGEEMLDCLREAMQANLSLKTRVERDASEVWNYRSVIDEALSLLGVPEMCIARRAAEEQLAAVKGNPLEGLSVVSGFCRMVAIEGAVIPVVGPVIIGADVLINVLDAIKGYLEYRQNHAAYHACLNPNQSLAEEPALIPAMLSIFFSLISAV